MPWVLINVVFILVLTVTAKSKRKKCTWDWRMTSRRLIWGIVAIVAVQIGVWIVLSTSGRSIGLLGLIQWIGVYWIALAICGRRDLRSRMAPVEPLSL